MKPTKPAPTPVAHHSTDTAHSLLVSYSGMDGNRFVLGDGTLTALSTHRLHLQGDCHVKPGMALALMVAIPGSDDHVYLVDMQVAASTWNTFEVDLQQVPEEMRRQLAKLAQEILQEPVDAFVGV